MRGKKLYQHVRCNKINQPNQGGVEFLVIKGRLLKNRKYIWCGTWFLCTCEYIFKVELIKNKRVITHSTLHSYHSLKYRLVIIIDVIPCHILLFIYNIISCLSLYCNWSSAYDYFVIESYVLLKKKYSYLLTLFLNVIIRTRKPCFRAIISMVMCVPVLPKSVIPDHTP